MYDLGIVGAGPAGAVLARLLAGRFRVLLLDSGRTKCCGGILAPEAQKMLALLDLALPKAVLVDPQPFAVAVLDTTTALLRYYSRQYINIHRGAFDRWLRSLVPPDIDLRSEAVYRFSEPASSPKDPMTIHFTESGEPRTARVRCLIGADGAASVVRREFFSADVFPKRYLAIQDWYDEGEIVADATSSDRTIDFRNNYVGIFDREFTDFYAWTIPKDGRLVVGGALPFGPHSRERFELFKKKLEQFGLRLGTPGLREAGQLVRPLSRRSICLGSERIALLGEAAGLISPSSAEGISGALASAACLAESFNEQGFDPKKYRKNAQRLIWSVWRKILKCPAMFQPSIRKQVMRFGLTAMKR